MLSSVRFIVVRRRVLIAALFAVCLMLLFPGISLAHAILLRSDPAKDAVLPVAPIRYACGLVKRSIRRSARRL